MTDAPTTDTAEPADEAPTVPNTPAHSASEDAVRRTMTTFRSSVDSATEKIRHALHVGR
jgi:hypothetical protein